MPRNKAPVIILVRPQLGENIGACARAMNNFGLSELRLVAPRDGWPNQRAWEVSSGADAILNKATVYPDTAAALADITLAFATTARERDLEKEVCTPQEAIKTIIPALHAGRKAALLFGPERTGLENDDITLCDGFLTIPTAPEHFSLNLAQAAVILGYEWFKQNSVKATPPTKSAVRAKNAAPASKEEWAGLFDQLEAYLDEVNFFRVPEKKPVMWHNTRNMLMRGKFTSQEIRTLRGILRVLKEGRKERK